MQNLNVNLQVNITKLESTNKCTSTVTNGENSHSFPPDVCLYNHVYQRLGTRHFSANVWGIRSQMAVGIIHAELQLELRSPLMSLILRGKTEQISLQVNKNTSRKRAPVGHGLSLAYMRGSFANKRGVSACVSDSHSDASTFIDFSAIVNSYKVLNF